MNPHLPPELHEPPVSTNRVMTIGLIGFSAAVLSLGLGLMTGAPLQPGLEHSLDGIRALIAVAGLIVAGSAASLRPGWFGGWLCVAGTGFVGYGFGTPPVAGTEWYLLPVRSWVAAVPNSWDSVQLFFGVAGLFGLIAALATRASRKVVLIGVLGWVGFHFLGIISAITSPPPSPWITDQYWQRIGRPYLHFAYLNNAYQFYSPDPGPATEIWACIEYAVPPDAAKNGEGEAPRDCEWIALPRRPRDLRDPLGLTFYRRLSLTENICQYMPPEYVPNPSEIALVQRRRNTSGGHIPRAPVPESWQYRIPNDLVTRQVLPAYARHLVHAYADPNKAVLGIKIYRTTHIIIDAEQFHQSYDSEYGQIEPMSPYYPPTYRAYFQGDFDKDGKLKSSTDPLLYWQLPFKQKSRLPDDRAEYLKNFDKYFEDYVSIHAGAKRPKE